MQTQILKYHAAALAGVLFTCHFAMAQQQWVPSGPPGAPQIPFDAVVTGYIDPTSPGAQKIPLYTCRGGANEGYGVQLGRFTPGSTGCEFGYGGADVTVPDFEFLITSWQSANGGFVPPNAVPGGVDTPPPGSTVKPVLYRCRGAVKDGSTVSLQLGKIRPGFAGCLVPYSGREYLLANYEVLVSLSPAYPLATVSSGFGAIPQDAIRAGTDDDGTPLYLCTAVYNDSSHPGKLRASFKGCNISYGGVEYTIPEYYVPVSDWLGTEKFDFPAGVDTDGSPLHVCRALLNGVAYPGKMRADWTACSYGLAGKEQWGSFFEVLSH